MKKDISFIYFDVGGVLIHDFSGNNNKWNELLSDLGLKTDQMEVFLNHWKIYEGDICIGKGKIDDFIESLRNNFQIDIASSYSMLDGFIERFEKNTELETILYNLGKYYRIGLLTNMYPNMLKGIEEKGILPRFNWDSVIDSSIVGYKKPGEEIYKLAEEKAGVSPEELIFIDNKEENLLIPKKRGWKTILYDSRACERSNSLINDFLL